MYDADLKQHVDKLFTSAIDQTINLPMLHKELIKHYERLQQPIRVAIVGKIKAGKSTIMNALLEEKVVETGTIETTFNVNWLRYGSKHGLTVHYKDEHRPPEQKSYQELAALTRRSEDSQVLAYLRSIKYIQVSYPNDILHSFDLIDTPGLQSTYEDDSQNTLDFIMQYGKELTSTTQQEAAKADAVLYLFSKGLSESDDSTLQEFQGDVVRQARPFNAIGVLTKVDMHWRVYDDPVRGADAITQQLFDNLHVRKLFYTIRPVAGLLAFGAKTMTADEFKTLTEVAKLAPERFHRLIQSEDRFKKEYPDMPIPAVQREQVVKRLGQYGIQLAYTLIREGVIEQEKLAKALFERSGLPEVRKLILSHFGNRAYLIKLHTVLSRLESTFIEVRRDLRGADKKLVSNIAGNFQLLRLREHAFQAIEVLGNYYEGRLALTDAEAEELLRITGEYGITHRARLGLPENATAEEVRRTAEAHLHYWQDRATDFGFDRASDTAAKVIAQSYNRILDHQLLAS